MTRFPGERRESLDELDPDFRRRLLALDEPVARDSWDDVVTRSRRHAPSRRRGAAVAVLALSACCVLVAASILRSTPGHPHSLGVAGSVPDRTAPTSYAVSQARATSGAAAGANRFALYVTATTSGAFCYHWGDAAGGCHRLRETPIQVTWTKDRLLGSVSAATISSVKILFTDGTSVTPPISWFTYPVRAGFFFYRIPRGKTVASVSGVDSGQDAGQITWYSV